MDGDLRGGPSRSSARRGVSRAIDKDWRVQALSIAGIFFIMLGLAALALPASQEGEVLWVITPEHSLRMMDALGSFAAGLGVLLTWLGGLLWRQRMEASF